MTPERPTRTGLLRDTSFQRLFAATALGALADRIVFLALPLVAIVALDVGELQVGLLSAATMAGTFIVGLPAGAWVDRVRKRTVLINTERDRRTGGNVGQLHRHGRLGAVRREHP